MRRKFLIRGCVLNADGFIFRIQNTTQTDSFIVRAGFGDSRASLAFRGSLHG